MNIVQKVKKGTCFGPSGARDARGLEVWTSTTPYGREVYFDCVGRSGKVLRGGFMIDEASAKELVKKLAGVFDPPQEQCTVRIGPGVYRAILLSEHDRSGHCPKCGGTNISWAVTGPRAEDDGYALRGVCDCKAEFEEHYRYGGTTLVE